VLALAAPCPLLAATNPVDSPADIAALRREMAAIRADYEARLRALEQRLQAAEAHAAAASSAAAAPPAAAAAQGIVASPMAPTVAPASTAPATAAAGGASSFNPAVSLILSGLYTRTSQDPARYAISGFQLPVDAEVGPGTRGLSLAETELGLSAQIDPWLRGAASIALHPDDSVSVEEAFIQTTALGRGLTLKAGRFFSSVGYLNAQHAHTWDFVDSPLAYQAMLGTQYGDDGARFSWLAPTDQFVELGLEVGRGRGFPGGDNGRNGAGMTALTAHTGGDIGDSHSWRAGLSWQRTRADDQALVGQAAGGAAVANAFSGRTRLWIADAVWKWAPNGNASRTSFKLQGEYLRSTRSGSLVYDVGNTDSAGDYRSAQSGWYVQGVYQFMPRWRVGLRTEALDAGSPDYGVNAGLLASTGFKPRKDGVMVDFNPSEFSRVRLQLARDRSQPGASDNQLFLQYQMSLGAHGAHGY
jgi:hypothetical protein